ncbi:GNAT family N-acetyltransferase [Agrococcus carbonis]|uniref:Acetyltransferase (GNAT) family protein n=1 Tax=Agrococcus carbonis TaxID=684552 RepID=A0A1H1Q951_9MICO|nr:GNAT family N-acetyltransferase [Agrococcus carbonis]SDS20012.1 Acetyltransferase (GNAT) family protein [Agrococcus carbonis]
MELRSPASTDEAIRWLRAGTPTIDTPANRARLASGALERGFALGHRRPELVWAATAGPRVLGLVAAREVGDARLIDVLCLPDDADASAALLRRATEWALPSDDAEVSFGGPAHEPLRAPGVRRVLEPLEALGWRLRAARRHYELPASAVRAAAPQPGLRLERAAPGDEHRLTMLLETVLDGSLDARDRRAVDEHGLEGAARGLAHELLAADPIECIRFAVDDGADGRRDVGVASWLVMPSGHGYLLRVGVARAARGRGLGRALVAAATADLRAGGAHTLIADTDDENAPMQRAFAAAGWAPTESRIELVLA